MPVTTDKFSYKKWLVTKCKEEGGHSFLLRVSWGKSWLECNQCGLRKKDEGKEEEIEQEEEIMEVL